MNPRVVISRDCGAGLGFSGKADPSHAEVARFVYYHFPPVSSLGKVGASARQLTFSRAIDHIASQVTL